MRASACVWVLVMAACTSGKDEPDPFDDTDTTEDSDTTSETEETEETVDSDTPDETESDTPEETETAPPALSHATDIQPIWNANCSYCHMGDFAFGNLDLTNAYTSLVGVTSTQSTALLVSAGDANASYLWAKLNDQQAAAGGLGDQMPQGGVLSPTDLQTVQDWINGGALP